jgi:hypothetical protein
MDSTAAPSGSGDLATDLRMEGDDPFHQIADAGCANRDAAKLGVPDHEDGGCFKAEGFWISGIYNGNFNADQNFDFSFGQGNQRGADSLDRIGAGG